MWFIDWVTAVVFVDGWWKRHPRDWNEIKQNYGKVTQKFVHFDRLVDMNKKRGHPIHGIQCKVCGSKWFTSCKKDLCRNIICWYKYGRSH